MNNLSKPNKKRLKLLGILFALVSSCAPKPPDVPVCENLAQRIYKDEKTGHTMIKPSPTCMEKIGEPDCGHCVYIVSGKEIFIGELKENQFNGKTWEQLKSESVFMPSQESYAPLATYLINSCKRLNCSQDIDRFKVKLDELKALTN